MNDDDRRRDLDDALYEMFTPGIGVFVIVLVLLWLGVI